MGRSCPLEIAHDFPANLSLLLLLFLIHDFIGHIINPLLTKLVRSRWLDVGLVLFLRFLDLDFVSVHKTQKKRRTWPITWPTSSHLELALGQ